ncbi:hypothetical protein CGH23_23150, partial [Vibrio parahaemolyticus]|uniref:helix-turn-helix domain-containing protein n=1 Tax=Vibrio parahaemolyticus TaxID=670 RepID=UPI00111D58DE
MNIDGKRLKYLRNQKLLTQEKLAIMSGLNIRTIQRVEKTGVASKETLKALCAALEVKSDTFQPPSTVTPTNWKVSMFTATIIGIIILWGSFKTNEQQLKP